MAKLTKKTTGMLEKFIIKQWNEAGTFKLTGTLTNDRDTTAGTLQLARPHCNAISQALKQLETPELQGRVVRRCKLWGVGWVSSGQMALSMSWISTIGIEDQLRKSKFLGHLPLHCLPFDFLWNQFWISRSTRPITKWMDILNNEEDVIQENLWNFPCCGNKQTSHPVSSYWGVSIY